ncbi:MFS transporter [Kineococcus glutinatus]|uniref:Multidrug efflux pump Tap n=1 Tax=Kineococcus glutinatus TaxID=1070872 RepID=A0ABP9H793_9ACTN
MTTHTGDDAPAPAPQTTRSRLVLPLYATAEGLSFLGNAAVTVVLPWLVLARTGDPAAAALVAAASGTAQVAATAAVGPLVDRFGARRMAVLADVGSTASVGALALLDASSALGLGAITALAVAGAFFDLPGMTARQTLLPRVAARSGRSLESAAGLRQAVFGLSFLAGPALAGLLVAAIGPGRALWITAACSALAALATLGVRVPDPEPDDAPAGLRGTWRTVRGLPVVVKLLGVAAASSLVSAPLLSVLLPAHFSGTGRPELLGFTSSAFAVGIVAGSAVFAVLVRVSRRAAWTASLVLVGAGLALLATLQGFWLVAAGAVVVGVGSGLVNPVFGVVLAERVPGSQLARVTALANAVSLVAGPLGLGLAGAVVAGASLPVLAWGIVLAWVLIALLAGTGRSLRDLEPPAAGPSGQGAGA